MSRRELVFGLAFGVTGCLLVGVFAVFFLPSTWPQPVFTILGAAGALTGYWFGLCIA